MNTPVTQTTQPRKIFASSLSFGLVHCPDCPDGVALDGSLWGVELRDDGTRDWVQLARPDIELITEWHHGVGGRYDKEAGELREKLYYHRYQPVDRLRFSRATLSHVVG